MAYNSVAKSFQHFFMADSKIVWQNTLDGKFQCQVEEYMETWGYLTMRLIGTGETVYTKAVPISRYFKAQDVLWWGRYCIAAARKLP
jgi:hypothetical protein